MLSYCNLKSFSISNYLILIFTVSFLMISPIYIDTIFAQENEISNRENNDITYVAKFVCGSINGDEGPLRPGHYDTGISITNKQLSKVSFLWLATVNDGPTSHSTLMTLDHQKSTGLDCRDIKKVVGLENSTSILEGFVFVTIPQDYNLANPNTVIQYSSNDINLLDVQVFFTANALDTLPHEVVMEKISFYVLHDDTGKIPTNMIKTTLDVTLESKLNVISDTEKKVKEILSTTYGISENDFDKIEIRIKNVSLGVGSMIDDHAISLSILKPQLYPKNNQQ
ncbi:hypothetical protein BG20_I0012 [Candidatus Nitrosarchaeum limnium BG20]|uniref:Uncharacterized protein n=1 Tax=Candidatus Nitrosarchaeum limnium BG20 TaxID=859192 RepID=S2E7M0_9ARCH|nr:hypothetical protein BG20_I0012 [Candidatus Nitrosarchaeum limnium BG20]